MVITRKIEVGISSNFLHSISTSICIRKCNKNWGSFLAIFWKKAWAIVQVITLKFISSMQNPKVGIGSNFPHSISTSLGIRNLA